MTHSELIVILSHKKPFEFVLKKYSGIDMANTEQIYEDVKKSVMVACEKKNFHLAKEKALRFGFSEHDESKLVTVCIKYLYQGEDGNRVKLEYRSYDQTGAGEVFRPDMNKLILRLYEGKVLKETYEDSYED